FARAAGYRELELVRCAQSLVAVLDRNREADAVLHAAAAPGRADARFHGAHGFAVRMARFEPGVDQLFPYERQLVHLRAEEIDALTARDLRVKTVLLRDRADRDQLVRGDLAARDARHDGIRAVLLHVREEVVVRVLQHGLIALQNELVPTGRHDRCNRGLADVATESATVLLEHLAERTQLADAYEVIELLARVGEVLAEMVVHGDAATCELRFEYLGDERAAASAGRGRLRCRLECTDGRAARFDRCAERAFADVVAGADLRTFGQRCDARRAALLCVALEARHDHRLRVLGQFRAVEHHLQPNAVVLGIADQDAAEQAGTVFVDDELLVRLPMLVDERVRTRI